MAITKEQKEIVDNRIHQIWPTKSSDLSIEVLLNYQPKPQFSTWESIKGKDHCQIIESLFLGFPIPMITLLTVETPEDTEYYIVDEFNYLLALMNFVENKLTLKNLEYLPELNGFKFSDLSTARQMRFKRIVVRVIFLKTLNPMPYYLMQPH